MFPSPRNNTESQVLLLQGAKCQRILYGEDYAKRVRPWSEEASVDSLPMLSLNKMFHESAASAYPYDETFESAEFDPIIILHTSGSTGNPKPIYCNQGLFCSADNYHNLATLDGLSYFIEAMAVYSKRSYCPRRCTNLWPSLYITDVLLQCLFSTRLVFMFASVPAHSGRSR